MNVCLLVRGKEYESSDMHVSANYSRTKRELCSNCSLKLPTDFEDFNIYALFYIFIIIFTYV